MISTFCLILSIVAVHAQLQDCEFGGQMYKTGDHFQSTDGCNTCFCSNGAVACTLKFCLPATHTTCTYGNKTYNDNDSFDSLDGCNTCGCQNGAVMCTEMFCLPSTELPPP